MRIHISWPLALKIAFFISAIFFITLLFFQYDKNVKLNEEKISEAPVVEKPVRILFVGDMMFDRYIRQISQKKHDACFPFRRVTQFLQNFDMVIGNNEGPITSNNSLSIKTTATSAESLTFTFDSEILNCYQQNNIKIVGIGNNHIENFGISGIKQTTSSLNSANIGFFGNPLDANENYIIKKVGTKNIAIVAYNYAYGLSPEEVINQIEKIHQKINTVIVFAHWGNEYDLHHNNLQGELGHKFIDAGADVVIGMHPHVIQDAEIYKSKKIYYSLGNFIFDQYFSEETKKGMGVSMTINVDNTLNFEENFFRIASDGQVQLISKD